MLWKSAYWKDTMLLITYERTHETGRRKETRKFFSSRLFGARYCSFLFEVLRQSVNCIRNSNDIFVFMHRIKFLVGFGIESSSSLQ